MTAASRKPYLPEATERLSHWPAGPCPVGGSGATCDITFTTRKNLQGHLTSKVHNLSAEEAREKADEVEARDAPFELVSRAENTKDVESYVENGDEDRMFV